MPEEHIGMLHWETKTDAKGKNPRTTAHVHLTINGIEVQRSAAWDKIQAHIRGINSPLKVKTQWGISRNLLSLEPVPLDPLDVGPVDQWEAPNLPEQGAGFHNPYNYVPAFPTKADGPLGLAPPVGHEAYFDDHFTGEIEIVIEVKTPLLLPDTSSTDLYQRW